MIPAALPSEVQALEALLQHFHSILWMSYREGFTPIGASEVWASAPLAPLLILPLLPPLLRAQVPRRARWSKLPAHESPWPIR